MKKPILITLSILYIVLLHCSIALLEDEKTADPSMISDISRMMPVRITKLVKHAETESIQETIKDAKDKNLKISIAGMRHSQGGHTYYKDAVVLDMTTYNKILEFNSDAKTITVQSGATWDDIQEYINPHNLAIKVMQSQNIFTIGGSLSVNVHGRDIRHGSLIESVNSFRLLKADGKIINVSRTENKELFPLVIGGYGLFGVILDVELQLTDDELYKVETQSMNYREYATYFKKQVKGNPDVRMHLARISTAPDAFLTKMYTTNYKTTKLDSKEVLTSYDELKEEHHVWLPKLLLGLSRDFNWGKNSLWKLQEEYFARENNSIITRNNVMRSESQFMEYENEEQTDISQEYFVPIDHFETYIDEMRLLLSEKELNLLNITIRYVEKNQDAVLSYAKDDMFALVLLINQGLSKEEQKKTENIIRKMIHITLKYDGSYYLPYIPYPSISQMHEAYPRSYEFFLAKKTYDNEELFMNYFYERYHNNDYQ